MVIEPRFPRAAPILLLPPPGQGHHHHVLAPRLFPDATTGIEAIQLGQADVDDGLAAGTTTTEAERIRALEQENRELRRANAILKSASAFFAAELDRPQK